MIPYTLIRSNRKTVSMQIGKDGSLIVRAPKRCSKAYIESFVEQHQAWAVKHQAEVRNILEARQNYRVWDGEQIPFCGDLLTVRLHSGDTLRLDRDAWQIWLPNRTVEELKPSMYQLYKREGREWLKKRLDLWSRIMGISYHAMRIGSATRRWGSCSREGNINLSWLLFFAPVDVVDYLLVHELSHRVHFDHSAAFWACVGNYIPDYPQRKKRLNQVYRQLLAQGWAVKS